MFEYGRRAKVEALKKLIESGKPLSDREIRRIFSNMRHFEIRDVHKNEITLAEYNDPNNSLNSKTVKVSIK